MKSCKYCCYMPGTDVLQDAQYGISLTVGIGTHAAILGRAL